jgi:hypothetical protein
LEDVGYASRTTIVQTQQENQNFYDSDMETFPARWPCLVAYATYIHQTYPGEGGGPREGEGGQVMPF